MRLILFIIIGTILGTSGAYSQKPAPTSASDIYHAVQKLNFLGSALYVAAHPDDENTRLISYLSNHVKARTAYLSMTRGDGGQNLIGPELRELLGVLRTQELLAARRIDGGQQFFTRANDFGYSKHPDETLKIWNKKEVLGDVVRIIRQFKPDVIVNRFDHRSPGSTHGHHTSSAMLSVEAFDLVNDPNAYPAQLKTLRPWQPKRLFFNTSWWFYGSQEKFEAADKSNMLNFDIGTYYPILGMSNNEIASLASSQHLCQGFGRLATRGSQDEFIEFLKGEMPANKENIFDGIDTTWSRIEGGEAVGTLLYPIEKNFNFNSPSEHLPQLLEAHRKLSGLAEGHWKSIKLKELEQLIAAVCGLYLEASADTSYTHPGGKVSLTIEAINRSNAVITLQSVNINTEKTITEANVLAANQKVVLETELEIPEDTDYTNAYWLNEKGTLGMYKVDDSGLIGKPETPRAFHALFELDFDGYAITFERPVIRRFARPDKGELFQPFEILPEATASFTDNVLIFADGRSKEIPLTIKAHKDNAQGEIQLQISEGWLVDMDTKPFEIAKKGDQQTVVFTLTPPAYEDESYLRPIIKIAGKEISKELIEIDYDHIPKQSILLPSEAKVVRLDIQKMGKNIGYIVGAGDDVPTSLEQIGYNVHLIDPERIGEGSLDQYDAVVTGIRAYNVVPELKFKQRYLLEYVKNGGNLIVQYNTAGRWDKQFENIAPYSLNLSRDRVTDENSKVTILEKNHPLTSFPNAIDETDFDGWVQERGLYFPDEWDGAFTPILSMKDEGESNKKGSLLVAPYGKGHYIYTGLSFFRELPAGVPGAYKLFANMLSIGKENVKNTSNVKG
ncbi:PIG-L family deacetylase [Flavobacteriaceae bacterium TP-CH-4]|uniref:PIG-L family deacetylase n=1 Tax=Pelagihabitans pacificus TaxID=2696054 RepID=A0A967AW58_9FLAO|nr:PIG-L family deacetylase [Pelagihabitans pacificus]NHF60250.1 PIG-L family deacetylase [Pelagihabitans pacificus]